MRAAQLLGHRHLGCSGPSVAAAACGSQRHHVQGVLLEALGSMPAVVVPYRSLVWAFAAPHLSDVAWPLLVQTLPGLKLLLAELPPDGLALMTGGTSLQKPADQAHTAQPSARRACFLCVSACWRPLCFVAAAGAAQEGAGWRRHSTLGAVPGRHCEARCTAVPCSNACCLSGGLCAPDGELCAACLACLKCRQRSIWPLSASARSVASLAGIVRHAAALCPAAMLLPVSRSLSAY